MNTTVKQLGLFTLILMVAVLGWGLVSPNPSHAQDTTQLEAECVAFISSGAFTVPASLTPQELCKVVVALFGNEWEKAAKLEATIILINNHDVRLIAAEASIVQLQVDVAALQAQIFLQPQIDAINVKLTNMAVALQ